MNKITLWCSALFIIIGSFTATSQTEGTDFPSGPTTDSNFTFNLVAGANTFSGSLDTPTDSQDNWQIVIGTGQTITSITYTIQNNFGISNGFFAFGLGRDRKNDVVIRILKDKKLDVIVKNIHSIT